MNTAANVFSSTGYDASFVALLDDVVAAYEANEIDSRFALEIALSVSASMALRTVDADDRERSLSLLVQRARNPLLIGIDERGRS